MDTMNFRYAIKKDYKLFKRVICTYPYEGKEVNYCVNVLYKNKADDQYYLDEAKKKIEALANSNKLEEYAKKVNANPNPTNKDNAKRKKTIIISSVAAFVVILAIVFGVNWKNWFIYIDTNYVLDSETLTIENPNVYLDRDANIAFVVKDFYKNYGYTYPASLEVVKVGEQELTDSQYTYDTSTGKLTIPAKFMKGELMIKAEAKPVDFASDSWNAIINYANQGLNELHLRYGRSSLVGLEHSITTSDNAIYKVRVIGEGHDRLVNEKTGDPSIKAASLTFEFESTVVNTEYAETISDYSDSKLRTVCADIYEAMPEDLKKAIRPVIKYTAAKESYPFTTEHVFPLSYREINGYEPLEVAYSSEEACYEYYRLLDTNELKSQRVKNSKYWLRSSDATSLLGANAISTSGERVLADFGDTYGVAPSFAIGETTSFVTDSWENVAEYADFGLDYLKEQYNLDTFIGQEREVITQDTGNIYRVRVVGENHDSISNSNKSTSLTFEFVTPLGGAGADYCPPYSYSPASSYSDSSIRNEITDLFAYGFPEILKKEIPFVDKKTVRVGGGIEVSSEQLFIPSLREMGDDYFGVAEPYSLEESAYQYYRQGNGKDAASINKLRIKGDGVYDAYWLRSCYCTKSNFAHFVDPNGYTYHEIGSQRAQANVIEQDTSGALHCYPMFALGISDPIINFSNDSWDNVCYHAEFGLEHLKEVYGEETFIGQEREVVLFDEKVTFSARVHVIGENADETIDGKKAALTFEFTSGINERDIKFCDDYQTPPSWTNSILRDYCNHTIINALPEILKDSIKEVKKKTVQYNGAEGGFTVVETTDKMFALSRNEIYDLDIDENPTDIEKFYRLNENPTYEYYVGSTNMVRHKKAGRYWTRSSDPEQTGYAPFSVLLIDGDNGQWVQRYKPTELGSVAPAFAI